MQVRRRRAVALLVLLLAIVATLLLARGCGGCGSGGGTTTKPGGKAPVAAKSQEASAVSPQQVSLTDDGIKVGTFLGDSSRHFYGLGPVPKRLDVLWKLHLGSGYSAGTPPTTWSGSGWTGQSNVITDGGRTYLIVSSYDHGLRKVDALTGKVVWRYEFDDIIKSSPSIFENPHPTDPSDRYVVCAGSRRGAGLSFGSPSVASYRAVSFKTGKELWRLPVPQTSCYSRDVDGSGFFLDGLQYIGIEPGWFYALDPFKTTAWGSYKKPVIKKQRLLLGDARAASHAGNLCLESSPMLLGDRIYLTTSGGHVYGLRRSDLKVEWDFYVGSDIDGSVVPRADGKLFVAIEKQYIKGKGGVFCLDPQKPPNKSAIVWYYPTGDRQLSEWLGGLIGSVAINDSYNPGGKYPALAAFNAIDGYLHVVSQTELVAEKKVRGPNLESGLRTPVEVAKLWNTGSISTPLLVGDSLISAAYDRYVNIHRLTFTPAEKGTPGALPSANGDGHWWKVSVNPAARSAPLGSAVESTPVLWNGRVYVGCRDGWYYCLGEKAGGGT